MGTSGACSVLPTLPACAPPPKPWFPTFGRSRNDIELREGHRKFMCSEILCSHWLQVDRTAMKQALSPDMLATDLAYYLAKKGVSFSSLML